MQAINPAKAIALAVLKQAVIDAKSEVLETNITKRRNGKEYRYTLSNNDEIEDAKHFLRSQRLENFCSENDIHLNTSYLRNHYEEIDCSEYDIGQNFSKLLQEGGE